LDWILKHWVACGLLLIYTGVLLHHAAVGRRASTGIEGYYVGARNLSGLVIGISFVATFASTNSYIGHAGKGYAYGLAWLVMAGTIVVFTYLSWKYVAPRLRAFTGAVGAVTVPDYLARRYGENAAVRTFAALVVVLASLLYLVAIFKGAGTLFEVFLGIPYEMAVFVTLVIVVLYTSVGGFVSVVRTDVIQGVLMMIGSVTIFLFVTDAAGGMTRLPELAEREETAFVFDPNGGIPFAVLLGIAFAGSLKLLVDPRQISRFYALRDAAEIRKGIWVAVFGLIAIQFCLFPVGIYAHFLLEGVTDTDTIIPTLVNDPAIFPLWVSDFLIVAIVAAAMSSIDSVLLVTASTAYNDLVRPRRASASPLFWTRACVVGFAVLGALVALRPPGGIVELTIFSGSLYAVCFVPAILVGLYWKGGSGAGVLASMTLGIAVLLAWLVLGGSGFVHEVFPALAVSLAVYVFVSRMRPQADPYWMKHAFPGGSESGG
tara:strand:- start:1736 stop:3199 length:1464 start_codon:yes stop_codon:yes gene_type:complete